MPFELFLRQLFAYSRLFASFMIPNTRHKPGFTLIEVLVAATIIALLTSIGVVSYQAANRQARDAKRKADLEQIRAALEMYKTDHAGNYPLGDCVNVNSLGLNSYLPSDVTPPKSGETYFYKVSADMKNYCVSANLETTPVPASSCTDLCGNNFGLKSP